MAIDFNTCITFKLKDGSRIAIPRSAILSVRTKKERDYTGGSATDVEITQLYVNIEVADLLGLPVDRANYNDLGVFVALADKYEIVLAILQGKPGAEVLF